MDAMKYWLETLKMADLAEKIVDQVLEAAGGKADKMSWALATATLATALDTVSMKCGVDPAETREAVLAVSPDVDRIVGDI